MSPSVSPPNTNSSLQDTPNVVDSLDKKSWSEFSRRAKNLESELDTKLLALSRLTSAALRSDRNSSFQSDAEALTEHIETGLKELAGLIDELSCLCDSETGAPPQHTAAHLLQRHRDIHMEYVRELRKAKMHLSACLQPPAMPRKESAASDYLLRENDRINHVSGIADHIIKYF
jgi:Golgi SNAP receptor complex protein 1